MHGDFKSGNIVLTENDYLDYEKNFPLIRSYLMSIFASKLVLRNSLVMSNIKEFCNNNPWYEDFRNKVWKLL